MEGTKIVDATRSFERWLAAHTRLVRADLDFKHTMMAADVFSFMRATYYRWAQVWPEHCRELAAGTPLLGVGDLHVENFGTWRDVEGRLIWGVNDFDEAHQVAYANDLVRLAVSATLAIRAGHLNITVKEACRAILAGYRSGISGEGQPLVLAEHDRWLRLQASGDLRDPVAFWAHMGRLSPARSVPVPARKLLVDMLPAKAALVGLRTRRAGLGSLGHQRYVALATAAGSLLAREAKAMVPPAADWVLGSKKADRIHYQTIVDRAVRCPDPMLHVHEGWVIRRLAPDCSRVELASLPVERDEARLLRAMGRETANVHHGSPAAIPAIRKDIDKRPAGWLRSASRTMAGAVTADWKEWRAAHR